MRVENGKGKSRKRLELLAKMSWQDLEAEICETS